VGGNREKRQKNFLALPKNKIEEEKRGPEKKRAKGGGKIKKKCRYHLRKKGKKAVSCSGRGSV